MVIVNEKYIVYQRNGKYMICAKSFQHLLDESEIVTTCESYDAATWWVWSNE